MKTKNFKMTELGPIPKDWEVKRLGDVGEPLMCKRVLKSQTSDSGDVPFYKIGTFGGEADSFISQELFDSYRRQYSYPKKGDVLISAAGTIGRSVVFDGKDAYFQDSNIVWIGNDETVVSNEYLRWCYGTVKWHTEDGGTVSRLYNNNLRETLILVPPLPEQRKIAAALSDVDEMIAALEKLIEKKRKIKTGAMQRLLTGKTRLPGFKGAWVEKRLGDVAEINPASDALPVKFVYVDLESVVAGKLIFKRIITREGAPSRAQRRFQKYDVLFQTVRPYQQNNLFVDFDAEQFVASTGYAVLRGLSSVGDSWFIYYAIHGQGFLDQVMDNCTGTSYPAINPAKLGELCVSVPPTLAEQKAIAKVLGDMDEEIAALEAELAKTRQLKQGMMQELLTGKTRLI